MKRKQRRLLRLSVSLATGGAAFCILLSVLMEPDIPEANRSETETAEHTLFNRAETEEAAAQHAAETETRANEPHTETISGKQNLHTERERILNLAAGELAAIGKLTAEQIPDLFFACEIDDTIFARINGASYTENDAISLSELSYLKLLYYGFDGNTYVGEMIVNKKIENDVLSIFQTLYENNYPIERMTLIDAYGASDALSMEDNNTSAFNYRTISGSSKLSNHSYGMAIDLNPKYNPYVKTASDGSLVCQPESGREYADRSADFAYKIDENDLAFRLFTQAGFDWGGNWNSVRDYQHFEKKPEDPAASH